MYELLNRFGAMGAFFVRLDTLFLPRLVEDEPLVEALLVLPSG